MTTTLASALEASILEHEYRVHGRPWRESIETTNYEEAKRMLRELSPASCGLRPLQHLRRAGRPARRRTAHRTPGCRRGRRHGRVEEHNGAHNGRKPALRLVKAGS
jgi:hypothetical protein